MELNRKNSFDLGKTSPFFSVIMPSYRTEKKVVCRAVESVLKQTYKNWELIYVDDNCLGSKYKDASEELRNEINNTKVNFIIHSDNLGANTSRNDAIEQSKGEWLAFLDVDDYWDPEYLERVVNKIHSADQSVGIISTWIRVDNGHGTREIKSMCPDGNIYLREIYQDELSPSSGVCVLKSALIWAGGFDASLPARQDYDMWLRILKRYAAGFVREVGVTVVRDGHESISGNTEAHAMGTIAVLHKLMDAENLSAEVKAKVNNAQRTHLAKWLIMHGNGSRARRVLKTASSISSRGLFAVSYFATPLAILRIAARKVLYMKRS